MLKKHKVLRSINGLPNATNCNVLPSKLRPVKPFWKLPKVWVEKKNSKTMHHRKNTKNKIFVTFYIYVPIFRTLGPIINFLQPPPP